MGLAALLIITGLTGLSALTTTLIAKHRQNQKERRRRRAAASARVSALLNPESSAHATKGKKDSPACDPGKDENKGEDVEAEVHAVAATMPSTAFISSTIVPPHRSSALLTTATSATSSSGLRARARARVNSHAVSTVGSNNNSNSIMSTTTKSAAFNLSVPPCRYDPLDHVRVVKFADIVDETPTAVTADDKNADKGADAEGDTRSNLSIPDQTSADVSLATAEPSSPSPMSPIFNREIGAAGDIEYDERIVNNTPAADLSVRSLAFLDVDFNSFASIMPVPRVAAETKTDTDTTGSVAAHPATTSAGSADESAAAPSTPLSENNVDSVGATAPNDVSDHSTSPGHAIADETVEPAEIHTVSEQGFTNSGIGNAMAENNATSQPAQASKVPAVAADPASASVPTPVAESDIGSTASAADTVSVSLAPEDVPMIPGVGADGGNAVGTINPIVAAEEADAPPPETTIALDQTSATTVVNVLVTAAVAAEAAATPSAVDAEQPSLLAMIPDIYGAQNHHHDDPHALQQQDTPAFASNVALADALPAPPGDVVIVDDEFGVATVVVETDATPSLLTSSASVSPLEPVPTPSTAAVSSASTIRRRDTTKPRGYVHFAAEPLAVHPSLIDDDASAPPVATRLEEELERATEMEVLPAGSGTVSLSPGVGLGFSGDEHVSPHVIKQKGMLLSASAPVAAPSAAPVVPTSAPVQSTPTSTERKNNAKVDTNAQKRVTDRIREIERAAAASSASAPASRLPRRASVGLWRNGASGRESFFSGRLLPRRGSMSGALGRGSSMTSSSLASSSSSSTAAAVAAPAGTATTTSSSASASTSTSSNVGRGDENSTVPSQEPRHKDDRNVLPRRGSGLGLGGFRRSSERRSSGSKENLPRRGSGLPGLGRWAAGGRGRENGGEKGEKGDRRRLSQRFRVPPLRSRGQTPANLNLNESKQGGQ